MTRKRKVRYEIGVWASRPSFLIWSKVCKPRPHSLDSITRHHIYPLVTKKVWVGTSTTWNRPFGDPRDHGSNCVYILKKRFLCYCNNNLWGLSRLIHWIDYHNNILVTLNEIICTMLNLVTNTLSREWILGLRIGSGCDESNSRLALSCRTNITEKWICLLIPK